jgi:hypothetical protein
VTFSGPGKAASRLSKRRVSADRLWAIFARLAPIDAGQNRREGPDRQETFRSVSLRPQGIPTDNGRALAVVSANGFRHAVARAMREGALIKPPAAGDPSARFPQRLLRGFPSRPEATTAAIEMDRNALKKSAEAEEARWNRQKAA